MSNCERNFKRSFEIANCKVSTATGQIQWNAWCCSIYDLQWTNKAIQQQH